MVSNKNKKASRGVSVLELAIALTLIALVAGTALSVASGRMHNARLNTTKERLHFVMEAVEAYAKDLCHLPCPADGSLDADGFDAEDANFGLGLNDGDFTDGSWCTQFNYKDNDTNVIAGVVPVSSMKLSPALMRDGWERRFTYVVDEDLTYMAGYAAEEGEIEILNRTGGVVNANNVAVLVISHGPNGHGAWAGKGTIRLDKDVTNDEQENSWNGDGVTGDGAFDVQFVQQFLTTDFDDMLVYRAKWQMPPTSCE
jgi:type II secretory pathway pseudopilin PulG